MGEHRLQRRGNGSRAAASGRSRRAAAHGLSAEERRALLAGRLRERLPELEAAVATRAAAIADPAGVGDPAYPQNLRAALAAALEQGLAALELGERRAPAVPAAVLAQARLAARVRVPLETVLRRHLAANALLADFLAAEAERAELPSAELRPLLGEQATLLDGLLAAVSAEYSREARNRPSGAAERRRECVKRLLAGELVDAAELDYDLDGHHLGLMAKGEDGPELLRRLAAALELRLLFVRREEEPIWAAWLGGRRPPRPERALAALAELAPPRLLVSVGEPGEGLSGWRFSHLQAKAALPIAERRGEPALRYADVALLASILRDDLAASSLRQVYLAPLERGRDGGAAARRTLRAYFAAGRNVSATAAALGVDRRTVRNRIQAIEAQLGRPLGSVAADLEIALRLDP